MTSALQRIRNHQTMAIVSFPGFALLAGRRGRPGRRRPDLCRRRTMTAEQTTPRAAAASVTPAKHTNWFMYFPDSYRWSAAVTSMLGAAAYGGSDVGEVDRAGQQLRDQVGDDRAWFGAWRDAGDRVRELAGASLAAGHRLT